ncbi:Coenzyme F420 hydrogenase/dehydrogenase, beta subunit C-terminal domain [Methanomicrobium antiquum]|uniref:Coenzyme F420 hydrogenase/dehydrogenase, beta subunit C-terminal domain n=1 Tax=Methanomicrobium antiquum TaxID=487686 RepID=A0AAF0JUG4_9EURY|nr:Coenzyme F420 hydrogenase/dehydrogenase, beta subunit C-terminal domain [Methanomicrobium antiquum]MDD3978145.1 Coenzyme F420 hydrogenase/dehydrogenase, beta subunit C-terminal domain [Methanomicrobium sp.]WFN37783.1 Coenzyme F420 hydrogenase/dehydrogenase, beta subunit C-terminal domain [Methanomicrobium antiquum]
MTAKGDMLLAWAKDPACLERGECGGAVTAILKNALETGLVDAVFAVEKGYDIYTAKPAFITKPEDMDRLGGSLHCGTLLLPKHIKKFLNGAKDMKIAVTLKGCDAKALYELAKRQQINLDNIYSIGLNCGGSISPVAGRRMIEEKFGINPDNVVKEEIDKGQFIIITKDGEHKGIKIDDLEEEGFGRRANCQRCKTKVPRQCDIACGNWGVIGDKAGKATFVEVCSDKGAELVSKASSSGAIETTDADPQGIAIRAKIENSMFKLADKARAEQFAKLGEGKDRLKFIMDETSRCIKCYACIENCPICYCVECSTKKPYLVTPGQIPPPFMFHLIRYSHISDSCINCGQCEELCAMDIPNALYMHAIQVEMENMFGYVPGVNMDLPLLSLVEEPVERKRLNDTGDDQIFNIFSKN